MPITYSEYQLEDFEGYCACLDSFYQGTHPCPQYFEREFLEDLIQKHELLIVLAKHNGKVIGTSAAQLRRGHFENSVLLGMRYIDEAYQGRGIGSKLESYFMERVYYHFPDANSYYADVVTQNIACQKTIVRHGFVLTVIYPMLYRLVTYQRLYPESVYRMTMVDYVKANKYDLRTIYPPAEYAPIIEKFYQELKVPCHMLTAAPGEEALFDVDELPREGTAEIFVEKAGTDAAALVDAIQEYLQKKWIIALYINMCHPGADDLCRILQPMGFYFCGIKPLNQGKEYLVLCQTENHLGDLRNVQILPVYSDFANMVLGGIGQYEKQQ